MFNLERSSKSMRLTERSLEYFTLRDLACIYEIVDCFERCHATIRTSVYDEHKI
jgi:hypothetical protein